MSGEQSSNIEKQLETLELKLTTEEDEWFDGINQRIQLDIRKMTAAECGAHGYDLARDAMTIQQLYNKHNARHNWADISMKMLVVGRLGQFGNLSYSQRELAAIKDNEAATKLLRIKVSSQSRMDRLEFIASKINALAQAAIALQQSKRKSYE